MPIPLPRYATADAFAGGVLDDGSFVMAVVGFNAPRPGKLHPDCPFVRVDLPLLHGSGCYEAWTCERAPAWGTTGEVDFARSDGALFGSIRQRGDSDDLNTLAFDAYTRIIALAGEAGCPHIVRVFNYLPSITGISHETERYWAFNAGRQAAFDNCRWPLAAAPAASALGMRGGQPAIYFLAAAEPGRAVENPRQVSAYRYPPRYSPTSPSFSRAMMCGEPPCLFISGTASIVGHESRHVGDVAEQTAETLRNIAALLEAAGIGTLDEVAPRLKLKIYVRHMEDVPAIRRGLASLPPRAGEMFLHADICRRDLLMEIEAIAAAVEAK